MGMWRGLPLRMGGWAITPRWGSLKRSPPGSVQLPRLSKPFHKSLEEAICLVAIHHAMVDCQRHVTPRTNDDAIFTCVFGGDHHGSLLQLTNAQNRGLWLVDDNRRS